MSSGNFCGYIDPVTRHSYYTLYFVAEFDRPFSGTGAWTDGTLLPGAVEASGGTTYGTDGYPVPGRGSGVWVGFDTGDGTVVNVRVGISYVGVAEARANLASENPEGTPFETVRDRSPCGVERPAVADPGRRRHPGAAAHLLHGALSRAAAPQRLQ